MTESCTHHWILSRPYRDRLSDERNTKERCIHCGGERILVENLKTKDIYYTPIKYPERREDMIGMSKGEISSRHADYASRKRKEEIISIYHQLRSLKQASGALHIPQTYLRQLLISWDVYKSRGYKKKTSKGYIEEERKEPVNKQNTYKRFQFVEINAEAIIADIKSGMAGKEIKEKWQMSEKAFVNFRLRHGLLKQSSGAAMLKRTTEEMINIVDQVLAQPTIEAARACWEGVKITKGIN